MCNALVGRGAGLLLAAVFALFMVPHAALADTSAVATVVVDDVHDSTVLAPSCAPPPNVCSVFALPPAPTPIVQAQVIGAPGNLGRARIGKSPSVFANGVTVGVEARTQGASRRARATAEFSDGWACPGTCAFPASPPVPVLTGFKINGVIDDLLANPTLPLDPSFLELTIRYTARDAATGQVHESFDLSLCYDSGPCGFRATLNGVDITSQVQIGTNALGQTTLSLDTTHISLRSPFSTWNDELVAKADIQSGWSTLNHVVDFFSTFGVEVTSLDPTVVWVSQSGRVSATSVVPFADLSVRKLEIKDEEFEVKGSFTLGAASDGIDPLAQDVTLQVGTFTATIPNGSFTRHGKHQLTFEGVVDGVKLEVEIRERPDGRFKFKAEGEGADLSGTVNPVTVGLSIGDDGGSTTVTAKFKEATK